MRVSTIRYGKEALTGGEVDGWYVTVIGTGERDLRRCLALLRMLDRKKKEKP